MVNYAGVEDTGRPSTGKGNTSNAPKRVDYAGKMDSRPMVHGGAESVVKKFSGSVGDMRGGKRPSGGGSMSGGRTSSSSGGGY